MINEPMGGTKDGGTFESRLRIFQAKDAARHASELFFESFRAPFPIPRDHCGLPIPTPPENWRQYVALYDAPGAAPETVGFCNWIRYGDMYLQGGMCVKPGFYRRLSKADFKTVQARGGIAQLMMEHAATELNDCAAWFGYCGDAKALAVDLRAGYETTQHPMLIVKWFRKPAEPERRALVEAAAKIGPF